MATPHRKGPRSRRALTSCAAIRPRSNRPRRPCSKSSAAPSMTSCAWKQCGVTPHKGCCGCHPSRLEGGALASEDVLGDHTFLDFRGSVRNQVGHDVAKALLQRKFGGVAKVAAISRSNVPSVSWVNAMQSAGAWSRQMSIHLFDPCGSVRRGSRHNGVLRSE